jgi:glutamyl-tRNA reductase
MTIVNVGLSHRFAPAEMLEKLAVPSAELGDVLTRLRTVPSVDEVVVLSTCNRVEIYAAASGPAEQVSQAVAGLMASRGRLRTGEVLRMARTRVGSTGKLAARLLHEAGVARLSVAGRNAARAAEVAAALRAGHLLASDVPAMLAGADLLVTATGAAAPVVAAEPVRAARAQAGSRPLFVLDLGMPPDVDAAVGRLAGVKLVDLTALGGHRSPHPPQGPAPADRPGQGVLGRPGRAGLPRRAKAAFRSQNR